MQSKKPFYRGSGSLSREDAPICKGQLQIQAKKMARSNTSAERNDDEEDDVGALIYGESVS